MGHLGQSYRVRSLLGACLRSKGRQWVAGVGPPIQTYKNWSISKGWGSTFIPRFVRNIPQLLQSSIHTLCAIGAEYGFEGKRCIWCHGWELNMVCAYRGWPKTKIYTWSPVRSLSDLLIYKLTPSPMGNFLIDDSAFAFHLMSNNIAFLTQSHKVIAAKKKAKRDQIKEIIFDDEARR